MTESTTKLLTHLSVFLPIYLVFLRSLRHLSRQKSEAASRVLGVLHRADMRG